MNYEKSKVLLKKISALHQGLDTNSPSALERDLLLQYIRDLYESVREESDNSPKVAAQQTIIPPPEPIQTEPPVTRVPPPKAEPEKTDTPKMPDIAVERVDELIPSIPDELQGLFTESDASFDPSRILGGHIDDISRAMGINERILTVNELFKGDQSLFNETLTTLNGLADYNEAKLYLGSNVAKDLDWANERVKEKAMHFMHLVRRRYAN